MKPAVRVKIQCKRTASCLNPFGMTSIKTSLKVGFSDTAYSAKVFYDNQDISLVGLIMVPTRELALQTSQICIGELNFHPSPSPSKICPGCRDFPLFVELIYLLKRNRRDHPFYIQFVLQIITYNEWNSIELPSL